MLIFFLFFSLAFADVYILVEASYATRPHWPEIVEAVIYLVNQTPQPVNIIVYRGDCKVELVLTGRPTPQEIESTLYNISVFGDAPALVEAIKKVQSIPPQFPGNDRIIIVGSGGAGRCTYVDGCSVFEKVNMPIVAYTKYERTLVNLLKCVPYAYKTTYYLWNDIGLMEAIKRGSNKGRGIFTFPPPLQGGAPSSLPQENISIDGNILLLLLLLLGLGGVILYGIVWWALGKPEDSKKRPYDLAHHLFYFILSLIPGLSLYVWWRLWKLIYKLTDKPYNVLRRSIYAFLIILYFSTYIGNILLALGTLWLIGLGFSGFSLTDFGSLAIVATGGILIIGVLAAMLSILLNLFMVIKLSLYHKDYLLLGVFVVGYSLYILFSLIGAFLPIILPIIAIPLTVFYFLIFLIIDWRITYYLAIYE